MSFCTHIRQLSDCFTGFVILQGKNIHFSLKFCLRIEAVVSVKSIANFKIGVQMG